MKKNNVCEVYSLIGLINALVKDVFINLDIVEATFDDTYTIKLSWMNGVYHTQKVFSGNEILKDNGKLIAKLISEETGYDIYGDIEEIASCKKREKVKDKVDIGDFLSTYHLDFYSETAIEYIIRASLKDEKLKDLKKARWHLNKLIIKITGAELQKQKEEELAEAKKYCEDDIVATENLFNYINNAFGAQIFCTEEEKEKNRKP